LIGGEVFGDQCLGEEVVHLVGANAPAAVDGEVPGDANEPDAHVADGVEGMVMLDYADEGVLHDVFGFGAATEDGVGYAEQE